MDWLTHISSTLQIIIWSLQACLFSIGALFTATLLSVASAAAVFFVIVPAWTRLWNNDWNRLNAAFVSFMLATLTFFYCFIALGNARLDNYLESLLETARKEASLPFADWRQIGFPQGFTLLADGANVCAVLQQQAPAIQASIALKEPFRSWPILHIDTIKLNCDAVALENGVKRDDKRFDSNFDSIFGVAKQHLKASTKSFSSETLKYISCIFAAFFLTSLLHVALKAYADINEHRNPH
ncbi:MAG: hypothetical protein ACKN9T_15110 [Candidatus Methylumidiphilus sp.]